MTENGFIIFLDTHSVAALTSYCVWPFKYSMKRTEVWKGNEMYIVLMQKMKRPGITLISMIDATEALQFDCKQFPCCFID